MVELFSSLQDASEVHRSHAEQESKGGRDAMRRNWFLFLVSVCVTIAMPSSASLGQQAHPKFTSGGLQVVVNRAVLGRGQFDAQLVISLVVTNLGDDDIVVVAPEDPSVITDTGGTARARGLSGIPRSNCGHAVAHCVENFGLTPALIERHNSITVTLSFRADPNSKVCSADFSMPLFIQRGREIGRGDWRQVTVGLPNVMVC